MRLERVDSNVECNNGAKGLSQVSKWFRVGQGGTNDS